MPRPAVNPAEVKELLRWAHTDIQRQRLTELLRHGTTRKAASYAGVTKGQYDAVLKSCRDKRDGRHVITQTSHVDPDAVPSILFLDIETSTIRSHVWRTGMQYVGTQNFIDPDRQIICMSWKWRGEDEIYNVNWGDSSTYQGRMKGEREALKWVEEAISDSDIVVAHNGIRFDIPAIRGRLLHHKLPDIGSVIVEDTMVMAAGLGLPSRKLVDVARALGIGRLKDKTEYEWWKKLVEDNHINQEVLGWMVKYCDQDVNLLEQVYELLYPYMAKPMLHRGVFKGYHPDESCAKCGSLQLSLDGFQHTRKHKYRQKKCNECGYKFRESKRVR